MARYLDQVLNMNVWLNGFNDIFSCGHKKENIRKITDERMFLYRNSPLNQCLIKGGDTEIPIHDEITITRQFDMKQLCRTLVTEYKNDKKLSGQNLT